MKADRLIESIDALLAINAKGKTVPRVPGLAVELLEESRAHLSKRLPLFDRSAVQGVVIAACLIVTGYVGVTCHLLLAA